MSGVKRMTVSVDADDWARAQQAAGQLRAVNRELPGMLDAVRRDNQAAIERATAEVRARQDAVDRALAGLSEQTKKMEARARQRLQAQGAKLRGELRATADQLRAESRAALEDQERRFAEGLALERQERARETKELRDELAGIRADRDHSRVLATTLAADARLMRDAIAELPHEQFAPGRLAELSSRLDNAQRSVELGLGEAAFVQAQEAYLQLSELRAEIELRYTQWQAARLDAGNAVTLLQRQISLCASPDAVDENGEKVDGYTLDVDFWSEGELSRLREAVAGLGDRLAGQASPPSTEELRHIAAQAGGDLDQQLTGILALAQARQVASQARANLAEMVVTTLEDAAGYTWEEGQAIYAGNDERRAFYAKLRHLDDSEIVVEVAPDETGKSCSLRILSYDVGVPDEEERARRAHAVHASLLSQGLQVGAPSADASAPEQGPVDFAALRAAAPGGGAQVVRGTVVTEPERG
jgi:hypothetical protein